MNYLNGGYVMIKHNATQKDLAAAYKSNRPVLVYDENQKAHWAQINETVTTETVDDEVVTTYTYSYELINNITSLVDSEGNPRFIEGEGAPITTIEGLTSNYCRWSLSGTHLMVVFAFSVVSGTVMPSSSLIAQFTLPSWIMDKIYPVWRNKYLDTKACKLFAFDWGSQNIDVHFFKGTNNNLVMEQGGAVTLSSDKSARIQFDLLIDNNYSE